MQNTSVITIPITINIKHNPPHTMKAVNTSQGCLQLEPIVGRNLCSGYLSIILPQNGLPPITPGPLGGRFISS